MPSQPYSAAAEGRIYTLTGLAISAKILSGSALTFPLYSALFVRSMIRVETRHLTTTTIRNSTRGRYHGNQELRYPQGIRCLDLGMHRAGDRLRLPGSG